MAGDRHTVTSHDDVDVSWTIHHDVTTISSDLEDSNIFSSDLNTLLILYIVVGIIGFLDNLLVIVVIATSRSMRKRHTNWFLINQSVIDMFTAGVLAMNAYMPIITITSLADWLYCKLWLSAYFLWTLAMTSTYNLLMITLERYVAIVHPVWHKNHVTWKVTAVALVTPWLVGFLYSMYIPLLAKVVDGVCLALQYNSVLEGRILGVVTFIVQFALPLVTMIVCYTKIVLVFTKRRRATGNDAVSSTEDKSRSKAKENVLKTLVTVCVGFFLCWVWNQVFFFLFNVGVPVSFSNVFYPFSVVAAQCNCAINPFIYAAKYSEFRRALVRLVRRGKVGTSVESSYPADTSVNTAT